MVNNYRNINVGALISIGILLLLSNNLLSQVSNLSKPIITSFEKDQYGGGLHSWDIIPSPNGKIYFANDQGLLTFNGEHWSKVSLPNSTILRSLAIHQERIILGGQDEIGYINEFDQDGHSFVNLKRNIPEQYQSFSDVWEIFQQNDYTYFRTDHLLYILSNDRCNVIDRFNKISILTQTKSGRCFFSDFEQGIYEIIDGQIKFLNGSEAIGQAEIAFMVEIGNDEMLAITIEDGIFVSQNGIFQRLDCEASKFIKRNKAYTASAFENDKIAIGTQLGGIIIINQYGKIINQIDKRDGLLSNNISSIGIDHQNNIWVGTYNGINLIKYDYIFKEIIPDKENTSSAYGVQRWNNKLYVGTSSGLYYSDLETDYNKAQVFKRIKECNGQVWNLDIIDNQLFVAHNNGSFVIDKNNKVTNLQNFIGSWKYIEASNDQILVGCYNGILVLEKKGKQWEYKYKIPGFEESSRIMFKDSNNICWISHPYRGIFYIDLKTAPFTVKGNNSIANEQISTIGNNLLLFKNQVVLTNDTSAYLFNVENKQFEKSNILNENFPNKKPIRIYNTTEENYWAVTSDNVYLIKGNNEPIAFPIIRDQLVGGFETISSMENQAIVCTDKGILTVDPNKYGQHQNHSTFIDAVHIKFSGLDSTITNTKNSKINLSSDLRELTFKYSTDNFNNNENILYSTFLEGMDENWSDWTDVNFKSYNNLSHGAYSFAIKSKDELGSTAQIQKLDFYIAPKWHETILAKFIFILMIVGAIFSILFFPQKQFNKEKKALTTEKDKTQEELIKLQNQKLKDDIQFKNRELASTTMNILKKNETLNSIKLELEKISKNSDDKKVKSDIKRLLYLINSDKRIEEDWENFTNSFDQVHSNFLARIKEKHPTLSPKDLKLSAYLRMNLNTKEIAPLLNISIRGVEIARYRLRKKLEIESNTNLNDYMMNF